MTADGDRKWACLKAGNLPKLLFYCVANDKPHIIYVYIYILNYIHIYIYHII